MAGDEATLGVCTRSTAPCCMLCCIYGKNGKDVAAMPPLLSSRHLNSHRISSVVHAPVLHPGTTCFDWRSLTTKIKVMGGRCNAMQCLKLGTSGPSLCIPIKYPSNLLPIPNLYLPSRRQVDLITTVCPRSSYRTDPVPCCFRCSCKSL